MLSRSRSSRWWRKTTPNLASPRLHEVSVPSVELGPELRSQKGNPVLSLGECRAKARMVKFSGVAFRVSSNCRKGSYPRVQAAENHVAVVSNGWVKSVCCGSLIGLRGDLCYQNCGHSTYEVVSKACC